ncbi:hypothetical protein N9383_03035 [Granulosicoccus sp.]|nr:hypothetical protein [Granulosicoccus sp.]
MGKIKLTPEGTPLNVEQFCERTQNFSHKMELIDGKIYVEPDRRPFLEFVLENLGVDMAVSIGDPQVWRDAVARLDDA